MDKLIALAATVKHLFVATVNEQGVPHLATAERLCREEENLVAITAWFCPQTAKNILTNPSISVIVWDSDRDYGFQLTGEVERVIEVTMPNGYIPGETIVYPQIERKLVVRVHCVLDFSHALHSDSEVL